MVEKVFAHLEERYQASKVTRKQVYYFSVDDGK